MEVTVWSVYLLKQEGGGKERDTKYSEYSKINMQYYWYLLVQRC